MLIHGLAALRFVDYDRERKPCASEKVEKKMEGQNKLETTVLGNII